MCRKTERANQLRCGPGQGGAVASANESNYLKSCCRDQPDQGMVMITVRQLSILVVCAINHWPNGTGNSALAYQSVEKRQSGERER
jgi:hypothetical protein